MKLWHCHNARSLRPLWALEEMGLDYQLEVLPFPPRFFKKEFLDDNVLGTVPYFTDADARMTESTAICQYLAERYKKDQFKIDIEHPEYGDYLNWLHHADATLTFPQALFLRYSKLEPEERRQPQVAEDYRSWFLARLRRLDAHIEGKQYLCDGRFTVADIAVAYALYLGKLLGLSADYSPQVSGYLDRLMQRPAFIKSVSLTSNAGGGIDFASQ
ncbi:MAG: glutathione S-transferase [Arenicella sp.]|jgi:glutathione S-transferase